MPQLEQIPVQYDNSDTDISIIDKNINKGLIIALTILAFWAIGLIVLLSIDISKVYILLICVGIILETLLYTGIFITAHDAMHGIVFAKNRKINNFIGALCLFIYGLFSYNKLLKNHWLHHRYPASELDPDFCDRHPHNFFIWYFTFMKRYCNWVQILGFTIIFHSLRLIFHISIFNLILFWVLPSILSSLQLFYFGTFLPHRKLESGYTNSHHCTHLNSLPVFLSFIACYHFGYHEEHHEFPHVPWWKLPEVHQKYIN